MIFIKSFILAAAAKVVQELELDTLQPTLDNHEVVLVTFYANWCPYSRKFFQPFEEIAAEAGAKYPEITFAQFDCGKSKEHKNICFEHEADHYPELMLWQDGHLQELAFPRVKPAILAYIDKHMSPLSATVTCDELKLKMEDNPFSLVYFGSQSTELYNTFIEFGKFERDDTNIFNFDAPAECASEFDGQPDSIMMYRKDFKTEQKKSVHYKGSNLITELSTWTKTHLVPSYFDFDIIHNDLVLAQDSPVVIFFRDPKDEDANFMQAYKKAAEALEGKIAFAYAGLTNKIQLNLLRFMEMEKTDLPMLTALRPNEHLRYRSQVDMDRLDEDYIQRWVSAVIKREEKPWVRSAEEQDTSGPLVELVGTNYDQFTKDPTKEVFVDYYAPWCSHCQNLAPTYEQLALYYQYDADLVIARFDCTQNDVIGDWIKGYPTLMLYPLGEDSKPIEYKGARDFDTMSKWLKDKSTVLKNRSSTIKEDL